MVKLVEWRASNMVTGVEPCVRTRAGWVCWQGLVYGNGHLPTLFGPPEQPLSARVLARVKRELAEHYMSR